MFDWENTIAADSFVINAVSDLKGRNPGLNGSKSHHSVLGKITILLEKNIKLEPVYKS